VKESKRRRRLIKIKNIGKEVLEIHNPLKKNKK